MYSGRCSRCEYRGRYRCRGRCRRCKCKGRYTCRGRCRRCKYRDATGTKDAVGVISTGDVIGVVDAVCAVSTGGCFAAMFILGSIWLWVTIDACSFNRQLWLLIIWSCLWHAEHVSSRFVCSSPFERIRPVRATCKSFVCCLRACNRSKSGCVVLLRS
jgi:hypothetical protein